MNLVTANNILGGGTSSVPATRFQARADTAANWATNNPVLLANEIGRESDTGILRIGDGSTAFNSLGGIRQSQDPYFNQVRLLLHGDGTNGATVIPDSSSYGWAHATLGGTTQISTTGPKMGTGSIQIGNTASDFVQYGSSSLFSFLTQTWALEFWAYLNNTTGTKVFFELTSSASSSPLGSPLVGATGTTVFVRSGNGSNVDVNSSIAIAATTWTHMALVWDGANFKLYQGGTLGATNSTASGVTPTFLTLGNQASKAAPLDGKLDEVRLTVGVPRYTANFTAPTLPYPNA